MQKFKDAFRALFTEAQANIAALPEDDKPSAIFALECDLFLLATEYLESGKASESFRASFAAIRPYLKEYELEISETSGASLLDNLLSISLEGYSVILEFSNDIDKTVDNVEDYARYFFRRVEAEALFVAQLVATDSSAKGDK